MSDLVLYPKGKIHYDGKEEKKVKRVTAERDPFQCILEDSKFRESLGFGGFKYRKFRGCL